MQMTPNVTVEISETAPIVAAMIALHFLYYQGQ